jgi:hypothetical protein
MIKLLLMIATALSLSAEELTIHKGLGNFIEIILDRNEIVAKYFTPEAFLVGFDKGVTGEPSPITKDELCKYFEPGIEITEERKATYSEACGHYVVAILKQKGLTDTDLQEVRTGIIEAQAMLEEPELSDETKAKCIELLEDPTST